MFNKEWFGEVIVCLISRIVPKREHEINFRVKRRQSIFHYPPKMTKPPELFNFYKFSNVVFLQPSSISTFFTQSTLYSLQQFILIDPNFLPIPSRNFSSIYNTALNIDLFVIPLMVPFLNPIVQNNMKLHYVD